MGKHEATNPRDEGGKGESGGIDIMNGLMKLVDGMRE